MTTRPRLALAALIALAIGEIDVVQQKFTVIGYDHPAFAVEALNPQATVG